MRNLTTCLAIALTLGLAAPAAAAGGQGPVSHGPRDEALKWGDCPQFMPEGCEIAVLKGPPSKPNTDIFYRVPGGAEIARHWHTSPERMVLVTGKLQVTYDGEDPVVLTEDDYAYGPAEAPHTAKCLSSGPCTLFIAFVDPLDAMQGAPE